jgi:hypothetical protein
MGMTDPEKRALKGGGAGLARLPDLGELPVRVDRETAAQLLTKYFFRTERRTLERWPLRWQFLNGRAHCKTVELFEVAQRRLDDAPIVMGGQRANTAA